MAGEAFTVVEFPGLPSHVGIALRGHDIDRAAAVERCRAHYEAQAEEAAAALRMIAAGEEKVVRQRGVYAVTNRVEVPR